MYKRVLVIAAVSVALGVAWMQAKKADAAATRFSATIISTTAPAVTTGVCSSSGFESFCPTGPCQCLTITGATVQSPLFFGKGTANLKLTEDPNSPTAKGGSNCVPFFGTIAIIGAKNSGSMNVVGADCDPIIKNGPEVLTGGIGLAVPSPSPAVNGWGVLNGTDNTTKGVLRLTLKGPLS
jgi:hypothetical protein